MYQILSVTHIIHVFNDQFLTRSIDSSIKVEIVLLKAGFTLNALKEKFGAGILLRELLGESTRDTTLPTKNRKDRYRVNIWGWPLMYILRVCLLGNADEETESWKGHSKSCCLVGLIN